ncbi:acetyl/propionyl/methylcrotonyl-CoA carboxylase subunit alpha [Endozoicomonas ascidiicola]|uniref:acetyl/propionyl/methylcrotonyl-CoA carboxylase subunit alpha n=1 Tax=Endozoicomonas ascidiicola TaxID=1698521 RepID=UPI0008328507|nr:biotin carboxylase N-terminal domain-containing protein [Endozoicomonas ascidiicola]
MIKRLLIANRGEIACRVINTAHAMGIETIAIYSDADAQALHTQLATKAIYIGPSPASESYLKADHILEIAKQEAVDAIHPGYGFLSENAGFAEACQQSGIIFVGPPASAIDAMGSKSEAKKIMGEAGVPLTPGYHGDNQSDEQLTKEAQLIGYPLLIKAAYGGGGKGMRVVDNPSSLQQHLDSARREASKAFGNDKLLLERFVTTARHVEVQIFFDHHGNGVYLFDRDCSLQRRHQKVIEEAPAPGLSDDLRKAMGNAAVAAGKAIGYQGAGTVEFLLEGEQFYFMEMNTRLQVEHPVTEMITDLDLVNWQLTIAAGELLPLQQHELSVNGHAIEARLYAENPRQDFLPASGRIFSLAWPETHGNLRIDTGIKKSDSITAWYDPMVAKVIARGATRDAAIQRLHEALMDYGQAGVYDNRDFLIHLLKTPDFQQGLLSTHFIEQHPFSSELDDQYQVLSLAAIYQYEDQRQRVEIAATSLQLQSIVHLTLDDQLYQIRIHKDVDTYHLHFNDQSLSVIAHWQQESEGKSCQFTFTASSNMAKGRVIPMPGEQLKVFLPDTSYEVTLPGHKIDHDNDQDHKPVAPMSGAITAIMVKEGETVDQGAPLVIMEAMKMEHCIAAREAGVIKQIHFQTGDQVAAGSQLLSFQ